MKVNNVNYNSNPAFGTKLKLTGSRRMAEKFADALEGGLVAQSKRAEFDYGVMGSSDPIHIAIGHDADLFNEERYAPKKRKNPERVLKSFFEKADVLDLSKPLRFVIEGAQASVERFVSALKGGFAAQDTSLALGSAHNSKKTFIAIGDEAESLSNRVEGLMDAVGVDGPTLDKTVYDFFKDAQVIHVTE